MPQTMVPGGPEAPGAAAVTGRRRAALLVPLSGPSAAVGKAILDAAQLAVFDIAEDNFELVPRDSKGTPEGAAAAATAALRDGVQIILGPLLAAEVEAVQPLARQANVPVVAFSTEARLAGNGTYLLSFLPRQQVERVIRFAKEKGLTRIAALTPETPYGQLVVDAARSAAQQAGAEVTRVETYDPSSRDLTSVVRRLASFDQRKSALARERAQLEASSDEASKQALRRLQGRDTAGDAEFDALLLPEGGGRLKQIAPLLPYYDIDPDKVHLLGTGLWDDPGLGVEPALVGGWFAAPPHEARADFETRFQATYKRRPMRLATLGYDAAALAALLARDDHGGSFAPIAITNPSGFSGVDGIFRFLPDGTVQRGLAVLEVQKGGARVVDPAPESFQDLSF